MRKFISAVSAVLILSFSASAGINTVPLVLTKSFSAPFVVAGSPATLTFTITNPNLIPVTGIAFVDDLPFGLQVAVGAVPTSTCGGSVNFLFGQTLITFVGGTLAFSASCTITVPVVGTPGQYFNFTGTVQSDQTMSGPGAQASIIVIAADDFQVHYANVAVGDSVINITNTGASVPVPILEAQLPAPRIQIAPAAPINLCVNAYTFSPDEQLVSCCSCLVTPNALVALSARGDLISNTLTPAVPTSLVVKLIASSASGIAPAPTCDPSAVTPGSIALVTGLAAWATTLHAAPVTPGTPAGTYGITETPFIPSTLSPAELTRITTLCGFIRTNGSGFGICKACRLGGLGADRESERPSGR